MSSHMKQYDATEHLRDVISLTGLQYSIGIGFMKPLVAIVGRPNVGKSTFFNRMIGANQAIVEDKPGTTRDRIYGDTEWNGRIFTLIDTGGLELTTSNDMLKQVRAQAELAISEADVIFFLCDANAGLTSADLAVAEMLRQTNKPIILGINKADNAKRRQEAVEFYQLGLGEPITLSSRQGVGTGDVLDALVDVLPSKQGEDEADPSLPRIAIVGRPNVGKSSLLNSILGEDRVIVSDIPGTTRDAIDTVVEHAGAQIVLIDTAGVRRRGKITPGTEKYSVFRSERAVERADVALLLIDASEGITAQDTHIAGLIQENGTGVVIVVNKWDIIKDQRAEFRDALEDPTKKTELKEMPDAADEFRAHAQDALKFIPYAPILFTSAKTGYHVKPILDTALQIFMSRQRRIPTSELNSLVRETVQKHPPSQIKGRVLKILFATQAEINPPTFVFFVNDPALVHFGYERYLENQLRRAYTFPGTPIRLVFRMRSERGDE